MRWDSRCRALQGGSQVAPEEPRARARRRMPRAEPRARVGAAPGGRAEPRCDCDRSTRDPHAVSPRARLRGTRRSYPCFLSTLPLSRGLPLARTARCQLKLTVEHMRLPWRDLSPERGLGPENRRRSRDRDSRPILGASAGDLLGSAPIPHPRALDLPDQQLPRGDAAAAEEARVARQWGDARGTGLGRGVVGDGADRATSWRRRRPAGSVAMHQNVAVAAAVFLSPSTRRSATGSSTPG